MAEQIEIIFAERDPPKADPVSAPVPATTAPAQTAPQPPQPAPSSSTPAAASGAPAKPPARRRKVKQEPPRQPDRPEQDNQKLFGAIRTMAWNLLPHNIYIQLKVALEKLTHTLGAANTIRQQVLGRAATKRTRGPMPQPVRRARRGKRSNRRRNVQHTQAQVSTTAPRIRPSMRYRMQQLWQRATGTASRTAGRVKESIEGNEIGRNALEMVREARADGVRMRQWVSDTVRSTGQWAQRRLPTFSRWASAGARGMRSVGSGIASTAQRIGSAGTRTAAAMGIRGGAAAGVGAAGAAGGIAAAAMSTPVLAIGAVVAGFAVVGAAAVTLAGIFRREAGKLEEVSGAITGARVEREAIRLRNMIERNAAIGGAVASTERARTRLDDALTDLWTEILKELAKFEPALRVLIDVTTAGVRLTETGVNVVQAIAEATLDPTGALTKATPASELAEAMVAAMKAQRALESAFGGGQQQSPIDPVAAIWNVDPLKAVQNPAAANPAPPIQP
jgi:hypothetical protein